MASTIGSMDLASLKNLRDDVTQYFWFESSSSSAWGSGAHVTLYPESQFTNSGHANYLKGQNIIMNTDGFSIRNGVLPMMVLDNDSLDFNAIDTTLGTYTTLASFGLNGAFVQTKDDNNNIVEIAHLGYGQGTNSSGGISKAPYYSLGSRRTTSTAYSSSSTYKIGDLCVYNGAVYVCKTAIITAEAWNSNHWQLAIGTNSTTEGGTNVASGSSSHAEGFNSIAIGHFSHAEGEMTPGYKYTIAVGEGSHAEGGGTQALGRFAHSEGSSTQAIGAMSHAQNVGTIANGYAETAIGQFNTKDTYDTYALMIGNGTADNARSNALTVTWEGDVNIASGAHYKIGSANLKASDVSAVALSDKYTRSSAGDLDWTNQTDGDAKVIAKSALAFWNGAYNGDGSNLSKCSDGTIIGSKSVTDSGEAGKIPRIKSDGVLEIRKYIDMHDTNSSLDYDVRLTATTSGTAGTGTLNIGAGNFTWNGNVVLTNTTTTATPSITTSTGTLADSSIARSGKLRTLFLRVKNSSAINAGSNVYAGTLNTTSDRPALWATGVGYYGSSALMFQINNSTGAITGRVIGAQLPANAEVYTALTYVVS